MTTTTRFEKRMASGATGPRVNPVPAPANSSGRSSQAVSPFAPREVLSRSERRHPETDRDPQWVLTGALATWIVVAVVSAVAILISAPGLAGWMLLPAVPAALLWWARRRDGSTSRCDHAVMRIFSIATFVAIISQMVASVTSLLPLLIVAAAVVLFLLSVEQLASLRSR